MNPVLCPGAECLRCFGLGVVLLEKIIITLIVSLHWRGMRPIRAIHHRRHQKTGNYGAIGVTGDHLLRHDLFRADNHLFGCAHAFNHYTKISPAMRVAEFIGALHVDNGHIRLDGTDSHERFLRFEGRDDLVEEMIAPGNVAAHGSAGRQEWHTHSPGLERQRDTEIRHVEDAQLLAGSTGILLLGGTAEVVGRTHHHVAHPGGHYVFDAACADKLVKQNVGNGADQPEVALLLADDLVSGGKGDHLLHLEAKSNTGAIRHEISDGLLQGENFGHATESVYSVESLMRRMTAMVMKISCGTRQ